MPDTFPTTIEPGTPSGGAPKAAGGAVHRSPTSGAPSYEQRKAKRAARKREKVLDTLKTLVWVIPLTILIWVYAEREQNEVDKNVAIPIGVRINSADKIVTLHDSVVAATISGPHSSVQQLLNRMRDRPNEPIITRTIDAATPAGDTQIPASVLNDDPILRQSGIRLTDFAPSTLRATVDDLQRQELPVRAPEKIQGVEGDVRFSPATVWVTAPKSIFDEARRMQKVDKPYLVADLSKLKELGEAGPHDNIPGVPLIVGAFVGPHVEIRPQSVSASFVVRQRLDQYTVHNVPIWPTGNDDWLRKHDVEIVGSKTFDVVIEGPPDKVDALREAASQGQGEGVVALIYLGTDLGDDRGDLNKIPTFRLPEGTRLKPNQRFDVTVRVTPRGGP